MNLYAQHGYGEGEKINKGLAQRLIDGVVYGAKDISPDRLKSRLKEITKKWPRAGRFFDPQFYVSLLGLNPNLKIGKLDEYPFYKPRRRSQLESNNIIKDEIKNVIKYQIKLPVSGIIAPNIFISRSFDSVEAAISKNFIRHAQEVYGKFKDRRLIFATLAISREALIDISEMKIFLNDITLLDSPPDGFYLLVGARNVNARTDIYNADIIAAWMLLNHSLKINGFKIINGYSDVISSVLSAVGGDVGCTGWWSNLRTFSLERFAPEVSGGRLPVPRYLSTKLFNRILFHELDALSKIVPEILNGLPMDKAYTKGNEPERVNEVLQSWETLSDLLNTLTSTGNLTKNLKKCETALKTARALYTEINLGFRLDPKSDESHLEPLLEGINKFKKLAEI